MPTSIHTIYSLSDSISGNKQLQGQLEQSKTIEDVVHILSTILNPTEISRISDSLKGVHSNSLRLGDHELEWGYGVAPEALKSVGVACPSPSCYWVGCYQ